MRQHHVIAFAAALVFAVFLTHAASAQATTDHMKATAPEKMMPADMVSKMRECENRAKQQRTKMEDRTRFVNVCAWARKN
jgi:hypothetical protein